MSTSNPIIELRDVSFSYDGGREKALDAVSLSVREGDFVGVVGPSGAGKSTLAAMMSGAIPHHYAGKLYGATLVDGHDTCDVTLADISRMVGSVLQDIDTQMVASVVEDEMLFGLENFGVPHDKIEGRLAGALDAVGIADLRNREIATLSGGQKQKVAIAAILALEPRVLVLDEPTAALDPASSRHVFDTLHEVNERMGITVVVIEQKVALLSEYCGRIVVLDHGRVAFEGTPHEVFSHGEELREMGVRLKLNALIDNVAGKRLVVVDDSIVRGTTSKQIVRMLKDAGATEVHMRINSPEVTWPCFYGIDTDTQDQLISASKTVEEICEYIGADSLAFLSPEGLRACVPNLSHCDDCPSGRSGYCEACFTGEYPVEIPPSFSAGKFLDGYKPRNLAHASAVSHISVDDVANAEA